MRNATPFTAALVIAALALPSRAQAQVPVEAPPSGPGFEAPQLAPPPPPEDAPPPPVVDAPPPLVPTSPRPPLRATAKPLAPTGIGLTVAALAHLGLGVGLMVAGKHGAVECGLSGCHQRPDIPTRVTGSALLAAGVGLAAVGLPAALYGAARDGKVPARRDEPRMRAALIMAGVGLGLGLAGGTLAAQNQAIEHGMPGQGSTAVAAGSALAVLGGGLAIAAFPVGISARARDTPPEGSESPDDKPAVAGPKRPRLGIAIPGIALTLMGGGMLAGGVALGAKGGRDWVSGTAGMILLGFGGLHAAVGIPLTVVGLIPRPVATPAPAPPAALLPEVQVGLGSVNLRWDL